MSLFGALEELRTRPIGDLAGARAARQGFRSRIKLAGDNALFPEPVVEARDDRSAGHEIKGSDSNIRENRGQTPISAELTPSTEMGVCPRFSFGV